MKKRIKYGGNILASVAIILGILALVNFLSTRRFIRADLTEDKRYTISQATKDVLGTLDDIVTITVYFSTSPAEVAQLRQAVRDVLEEYRAFSNRLQIDFVNPADFDDGEKGEEQKRELYSKGIREHQINVPKEDKVEIANVYMSISVDYGGKAEVLPLVQSTANLEYNLTSAVVKVTTKEPKTVGFLTGHGGLDINAPNYQQLRQFLDKDGQGQYTLTTVSLQDGEAVDESVTTLVVAGVRQPLTERDKYEIDQFIMRGGRAIFLVDPIQIQPGTLQGSALSTGVNDLLEHYGAKLGNNLLLDAKSHDQLQFQRGFMRVIQPYPYFIRIVKPNFSVEHGITKQLEVLTLPWTSSVETVAREGVTATVLAKTTDAGRSVQGYYNLLPEAPIPPAAEAQAYPVAVALEGTFQSFYADKDIPAAPAVPGTEGADGTPLPVEDAAPRVTKTESEPTRIVVVGTAQFVTLPRQPGGIGFFLNTVDSLTLGDALIGIRSQTITYRPLREVTAIEKNLIKYLCIIGVPLLVVAFGLVRYFLKRRAKKFVETYGTL